MSAKRAAAVIVAALFLASLAIADDLYPPLWRTAPPGQGTTTFQAWEFSTSDNPAVPEVVFNSFGPPSAQITGTWPYTRWLDTDWSAPTHHGVWKFESPGTMTFSVPNSPTPDQFKDIWLQLTYYTDQGLDPVLTTVPAAAQIELVHKTQLDAYYWHDTFHIRIEPNPSFETITVAAPECTIYVDEAVLDTICAPEPTSLLLAAIGLLLRRR